MGRTIAQIIASVDEAVPNKIESTSKIKFLSDLIGDGSFRKYNDIETYWDTYTVANQAEYDLPSGVDISDIIWVGISGSTYNSTDSVGSTTIYVEQRYIGKDDSNIGYTDYTTKLALTYPPDGSYHMRVIYTPTYRSEYRASTDSTTIIYANKPLLNWLEAKLCAKVAKIGSFPRIDLANNYEIEAANYLSEAITTYDYKKRKRSRKQISYRDWW